MLKRVVALVLAVGLFVVGSPAAVFASQMTEREAVQVAKIMKKYAKPKWQDERLCIMHRESRGDFTADGRTGSGAYQFIGSTWDHYAGLAGFDRWVGKRPAKAPPAVQTAVFWRTWNKKKGAFHWGTHWANAPIRDCLG